MARGTQFLTLVTMLRAELERSVSPAVGLEDLPVLKQKLARNYETLQDNYTWPHLHREFDRVTLAAGQRYYDVPATVNFDRLDNVVVWWSGLAYPLIRGIRFEDYNAYDSTRDERSGPVEKWDIRFTGVKEQLEFWPLPNDDDQSVQFTGQAKLPRLVNDIDPCFLDDHLVVLFTAAELERDRGQKEIMLSAARDRLATLRANASPDDVTMIGGGRPRQGLFSNTVVRVR